jgi:DNA-binding NarL/FixJ family response regulator
MTGNGNGNGNGHDHGGRLSSGAGCDVAPLLEPEAPPLTSREAEILRWVAAGLPNKEVASTLGISLATVRNHIHSILEKLEVHSKLEAVSLAFRRGWVSGEPSDEVADDLAELEAEIA